MLGTMYPAELCEDCTLLSEYFGKHCTPSHVHLTIGNTNNSASRAYRAGFSLQVPLLFHFFGKLTRTKLSTITTISKM